jgi:hypothetical protein
MAVKVGDVITVKGWTSSTPRQRLKVLAVCDGYAWARMEERGRSGQFSGTHYSLPLDQVEAAPRRVKGPSLKRLKAAMVTAHPDRGGSHEEFIAAHEAYKRAAKEV